MFRRALIVPVLAVLLIASGCTFDYLFIAYTIECPRDGNGPTRCYPRNKWTRVKCTQFVSSGFELFAASYDLELDIDPAPAARGGARAAGFPKKLQIALTGTDAEGNEVFALKPPAWKVAKATGRVEQRLKVPNDLILPAGGTVCLDIKTKGSNELLDGMLMGILWEKVVATRVSP